MRQDVWKCFFVGVLCFWLLWETIVPERPAVRMEECILKVQEVETGREILQKEKKEDSGGRAARLYLNKSQYLNIHIMWIAKGCILILFFSAIKRAH